MDIKEKAKWLSEFYKGVSEGKEIKAKNYLEGYKVNKLGPDLGCDPENWILEEKQKIPIDLSVLIESKIDCEFFDYSRIQPCTPGIIGKLEKILDRNDKHPYLKKSYLEKYRGEWNACTPRMKHWHAWSTGKCPLPDGIVVRIICRNGMEKTSKPSLLEWDFEDMCGMDIIRFMIIGLEDGYCWPWEEEK